MRVKGKNCTACGVWRVGFGDLCDSCVKKAERQGRTVVTKPVTPPTRVTEKVTPPKPGEPCPTCGHVQPLSAAEKQRRYRARKSV